MSSKAGWTRVAFGDVVQLVRERSSDPERDGFERYVGLEHIDPGDLRIRRWGRVTEGTTFTNVFRAGQVLFGKRRAYQRKVAVADFDGVCSGDIYVFQSKSEHLLLELLPFICQTDRFFEHAVGTSAGSLSPRTNWNSLAAFEFPLPPLDEQRRIVAALSAIDAQRSALQETTIRVAELSDAVVSQVLGQRAGRDVLRLGDGCLRVTDGTHQPPPFTSHGVPFFLVKTISSGVVDWTHTKFVSAETYAELTRRIRPKRGDVLYTAVGATYGVAVLVDFDAEFVFQRHIAHIVPDPAKLLPRFLEIFLNSRFGRRQSDAAAGGSAQPTVTLTALSRFAVPRLSLAEQEQLCNRVQQLHSARQGIEERDKTLSTLRENVMRRLSA